MAARTFTQHLLEVSRSGGPRHDYAPILSGVAVAVKLIAAMVSRGPLILDQASRSALSAPSEVNRGLRKLATRALFAQTESIDQLAAISVVGNPAIFPVSASGRYLLLFEALHGMSNLIDNLPVGSAFSILERASHLGPVVEADFLQPGVQQVCAGIALFGPRTVLVVTTGQGVDGFTLDRDVGNFVLTHPQMMIPTDAHVFAINATEAPYWPAPVKRYVDECVQGVEGPRGNDFTMRWNASALVGAFRVLNSGGLFLVPDTGRKTGWLAPLLHTAAPLSFLAEQAGGRATTGTQRVLDVTPSALTARVPFFFGATAEVDRIEGYFTEHEQGLDEKSPYPLFQNRSLFVD